MPFCEAITNKGRLVQGVEVRQEDGCMRVPWINCREGEKLAVLIDRMHSHAWLLASPEDCKALAAAHGYELAEPEPRQLFVEKIGKLVLLHSSLARW